MNILLKKDSSNTGVYLCLVKMEENFKEMRINIKPLSVNEAWQGRRFKTSKYNSYQKSILLMLPSSMEVKAPICLDLIFGFSSKNADIDNPVKLFMDCLVKKYGFDDRDIYELRVKKEIVPKGKEFIDFEIY